MKVVFRSAKGAFVFVANSGFALLSRSERRRIQETLMASITQHLMTAEEFLPWTYREENRGRFFELERGEVVELPPPGKYHGFICANIVGILRDYAIAQRKGYVCGNDSGVVTERDPDSVRGPDISYYIDAQTADDMDRGYPELPPRLAVEVISPHDRVNPMMQRVAELLRAGVSMVWVVDPEPRDISLCRLGEELRLLSAEDTLTAEDILPGFTCAVKDIFATPGR
jgi:Uma2 family endonuclease